MFQLAVAGLRRRVRKIRSELALAYHATCGEGFRRSTHVEYVHRAVETPWRRWRWFLSISFRHLEQLHCWYFARTWRSVLVEQEFLKVHETRLGRAKSVRARRRRRNFHIVCRPAVPRPRLLLRLQDSPRRRPTGTDWRISMGTDARVLHAQPRSQVFCQRSLRRRHCAEVGILLRRWSWKDSVVTWVYRRHNFLRVSLVFFNDPVVQMRGCNRWIEIKSYRSRFQLIVEVLVRRRIKALDIVWCLTWSCLHWIIPRLISNVIVVVVSGLAAFWPSLKSPINVIASLERRIVVVVVVRRPLISGIEWWWHHFIVTV